MKMFISFCIAGAAALSCQRKMPPQTFSAVTSIIPVCIQQKIDSIKQLPVWNPPAEINEYNYGGNTVYSISAKCCDFYTVVVDSNCNYICAPSGGFTGKGDRKCTDFNEKAKLLRLIWRDERGTK